jgi:hypothetical protein
MNKTEQLNFDDIERWIKSLKLKKKKYDHILLIQFNISSKGQIWVLYETYDVKSRIHSSSYLRICCNFSSYIKKIFSPIFMLNDFVCLLLLFFYYVWMDVLWPVGISIGRLTRFIIPIHLVLLFLRLYFFFFFFYTYEFVYCVSEFRCIERWKQARIQRERQHLKKKKERYSSIHLLIDCLFSSPTSVRIMVVIFFFF